LSVGFHVISDKVNLDVIFEAKNMGCSYNLPNLSVKQEGSTTRGQYSKRAVQQEGSTARWQYSKRAVQQEGGTARWQYNKRAVQQEGSTEGGSTTRGRYRRGQYNKRAVHLDNSQGVITKAMFKTYPRIQMMLLSECPLVTWPVVVTSCFSTK
jgi:hypothetical protein